MLLALYGGTASAAITDTAEFTKASATPTIDGKIDDVWKSAKALPSLVTPPWNKLTATDAKDFSGTVKGMWDENNLYLLYEVTDSDFSAKDDYIRFYIDGGNEKLKPVDPEKSKEAADMNDFAGDIGPEHPYNIGLFKYSEPEANRKPINDKLKADSKTAAIRTDTGYVVELAIPLSDVGIKLKEGSKIGFVAVINDVDPKGETKSKVLEWADEDPDAWRSAANYGTITMAAGTAAPASTLNQASTSTDVSGSSSTGSSATKPADSSSALSAGTPTMPKTGNGMSSSLMAVYAAAVALLLTGVLTVVSRHRTKKQR